MEFPEKIQRVKEIRREVGADAYLHVFGMGVQPPVIKAVQANPNLIDSIDVSTPEQCRKNGKIQDMDFTQSNFNYPSGKGNRIKTAPFVTGLLIEMNHALSPYYNGEEIEENSALEW